MSQAERWQRVAELFEEAVALEPGAREAFVERASHGDDALAREVRGLLAADAGASGLFSGLRRWLTSGLGAGETGGSSGRVLGPYTLETEIGRGGMGEVYRARRTDRAYEARVAVKLLAGGPLTDGAVRRFHQERQILATLDHPAIARLLDGGTTDDGRPYLVMEYVEGSPIDAFCDNRRLGVDARLRLVREVCSAVQRAHQSLVVHRDLKPANVLVTADGAPKLLDFGIAKLLGGADLPLPTDATGTARPMTLTYASPEQVRGERLTTATDVYSLGVMLYRLLTGELPYRARGALHAAILHEEPPPASSRVSDAAARLRRTSPRQLRRALAGDLDNVLRKALAKHPYERYGSAEELGADLERHLDGLPVAARAPSLPYRLGKLVRRNPAASAVSVALVLALVAFAVVMAVLAGRLAEERNRARQGESAAAQVADLLVDLFTVSDPERSRGETVTAREVLDRGANRLEGELGDQPAVRARLLDAIGSAYEGLGLYEPAEAHLTAALALRRDVLGPERPETLESLRHVGSVRMAAGDFEGAQAMFREGLEVATRLYGAESLEIVEDLNHLASIQNLQRDFEGAEPFARQAHGILTSLGVETAQAADTLQLLASALINRRELEEAEALFREALAIRVRELGADHPDTLDTQMELANAVRYRGRQEEAETLFRDNVAAMRRVFGDDHPRLAYALTGLAYSLEEQGHAAEAEPVFREALELRRRVLGPRHPAVGVSTHNLAHALEELGRYAEALELYRRSEELLAEGFGPDHPFLAYSWSGIGRVLLAQDHPVEAEPYLRRTLAVRLEEWAEGDTLVAGAQDDLGRCLTVQGRYEEAEEHLLAAWETLSTSDHALERSVRRTREDLAALYQAWGQPERAAPFRAAG